MRETRSIVRTESVSTDFDVCSHGIDPVAGWVALFNHNETDRFFGIDLSPPRNQLTWLRKAKSVETDSSPIGA